MEKHANNNAKTVEQLRHSTILWKSVENVGGNRFLHADFVGTLHFTVVTTLKIVMNA